MSDHIDRLREDALSAELAAAVERADAAEHRADWLYKDCEAKHAEIKSLEAERDEAQEALQGLAADHYFARAEQAESALAEAREEIEALQRAVEWKNVGQMQELARAESDLAAARKALREIAGQPEEASTWWRDIARAVLAAGSGVDAVRHDDTLDPAPASAEGDTA